MARNPENADYSRLVERYGRVRKAAWKLQNHVLPEYLSKNAFETSAKKLGMKGRGNQIVFGNEDQMGVLMDYCLYDYMEEGGNAISRCLADSHPDPASDEYATLKAMSESFYTLVQVLEVLPGVGVRVGDLFAEREYLLTDMGFSQTAVKGIVLATRLLPFEDFVTTSGAPLPVDEETLHEIRNSILPRYGTEDGHDVLVDAERQADLRAAIIRLCLSSESADEIQYQDVETAQAVSPIRREARVGRNDLCPCGSGRKYKHCCGREM